MINKVILLGFLSKSPEIKINAKGEKFVVCFFIGTVESRKNPATKLFERKQEWHKVICANKYLSDILLKYSLKGALVAVEGRAFTTTYTKEGEIKERASTQILVQKVKVIDEQEAEFIADDIEE